MWLNKESVLNKVRDEQLYHHYFQINVNKKRGIKSPIRADDLNPSFCFKKDKDNKRNTFSFSTGIQAGLEKMKVE